jgi:hypothetical protein
MRSHRAPLRPSIAALIVIATAVCLVGPRRAASAADARAEREARARAACAAGRVEEGVAILAGLFARYGHPNYVYNQARCYQQNGRVDQALERFHEYRRVAPSGSAEEAARIDRFIDELEAKRAQAAEASAVGAALPRAPDITPPVPAPAEHRAEPAPQPLLTHAGSEPPGEPSHGLRTAGFVLGAVAIAGGVVGLLSGFKVRALEAEVEDARPGQFTVEELAEQADKAHRFEVFEGVGYGVGGAALAGAIVCFVLDATGDKSSAAKTDAWPAGLRLTSVFSPGGAGLGLVGRY